MNSIYGSCPHLNCGASRYVFHQGQQPIIEDRQIMTAYFIDWCADNALSAQIDNVNVEVPAAIPAAIPVPVPADIPCSICRSDDQDGLTEVKPCKHLFHVLCIKQWIIKQMEEMRFTTPTCPNCRVLLINEEVAEAAEEVAEAAEEVAEAAEEVAEAAEEVAEAARLGLRWEAGYDAGSELSSSDDDDSNDANLNRVRQPTMPYPIIPNLIFNYDPILNALENEILKDSIDNLNTEIDGHNRSVAIFYNTNPLTSISLIESNDSNVDNEICPPIPTRYHLMDAIAEFNNVNHDDDNDDDDDKWCRWHDCDCTFTAKWFQCNHNQCLSAALKYQRCYVCNNSDNSELNNTIFDVILENIENFENLN
jgi:hypothetical protein